MHIMTHVKFRFNQLMLTLIFGIGASEPLGPDRVKYRKNMSDNRFCEFHKSFLKSRNLNISRNKLYILAIQIKCFKMIYNIFMFYESDILIIFRTLENGLNFDNFVKIAHKIAKSKYFVDI